MRCAQILCGDVPCSEPAAYRFTWPGRPAALICRVCSARLRAVSRALDLRIELVDVRDDGDANEGA